MFEAPSLSDVLTVLFILFLAVGGVIFFMSYQSIMFENLSREHEDTIRKFIIEEQRETLKAYKMEELKEGSSS